MDVKLRCSDTADVNDGSWWAPVAVQVDQGGPSETSSAVDNTSMASSGQLVEPVTFNSHRISAVTRDWQHKRARQQSRTNQAPEIGDLLAVLRVSRSS